MARCHKILPNLLKEFFNMSLSPFSFFIILDSESYIGGIKGNVTGYFYER
jgi:hypothetical protein